MLARQISFLSFAAGVLILHRIPPPHTPPLSRRARVSAVSGALNFACDLAPFACRAGDVLAANDHLTRVLDLYDATKAKEPQNMPAAPATAAMGGSAPAMTATRAQSADEAPLSLLDLDFGGAPSNPAPAANTGASLDATFGMLGGSKASKRGCLGQPRLLVCEMFAMPPAPAHPRAWQHCLLGHTTGTRVCAAFALEVVHIFTHHSLQGTTAPHPIVSSVSLLFFFCAWCIHRTPRCLRTRFIVSPLPLGQACRTQRQPRNRLPLATTCSACCPDRRLLQPVRRCKRWVGLVDSAVWVVRQ